MFPPSSRPSRQRPSAPTRSTIPLYAYNLWPGAVIHEPAGDLVVLEVRRESENVLTLVRPLSLPVTATGQERPVDVRSWVDCDEVRIAGSVIDPHDFDDDNDGSVA